MVAQAAVVATKGVATISSDLASGVAAGPVIARSLK
jgi:hypothetical protein